MLSSYLNDRVFGTEFGREPRWVLALHGWRRTKEDFAGVLGPGNGSAAIDAVAIDLPGFGASPAPDEAWGAQQYAEHIGPILESMSDRVVVVGHSFGGRVAIELAATHPERVAALVLTGVPVTTPAALRKKPAFSYRLIRRLRRIGLISERHLERARQRYGSEDYRAATGVMRAVLVRLLAEDYLEALSNVSCPVDFVWGELDTVVPLEVAREAIRATKDGHLHVLPGVGHFVPTAAAASLRDLVVVRRP